MFSEPAWGEMFSPTLSLVEVCLRGTLMYFFIFLLLRVIRRETGSVSVADVLLLVLVADAAQNGMGGEHVSVTEGIVLVGTIVFWSVFIDWLGYKFAPIGRLLHPKPIELVRDGVPDHRNMRKNLITMDELMTSIRESGAEDLKKVRRAFIEGNGQISVVPSE